MSDVVFGDKDPEDAWDDADPTRVKLTILARVVRQLRERRDGRHAFRKADALRLAAKLRAELEADHELIEQIRADLEAL